MKELNGRELAGYIKERQAHEVRSLKARKIFPKLVIIRDSDNPVIVKYVNLKKRYGEDIGIEVVDIHASGLDALKEAVKSANEDTTVSGIIVQLPIVEKEKTDEVVRLISPSKDVDGLNPETSDAERIYDSATATAINWLMAGYNIDLANKKIAIVGRGRLVGMPLNRMWSNSGFDVKMFHRGDDLNELKNYDVIVTATGVPRIIKPEHIADGAVIVDAGTASEDGVLVGDVDESVREMKNLGAITPVVGGVGPLTVSALFDGVVRGSKG